MDRQLQEARRRFGMQPTLENYAYCIRIARQVGVDPFCYFCHRPVGNDQLLVCDCGAGFCQDCGHNYVCADPDCDVGFICPGCTDKCPNCHRGVCPGSHNTTCEAGGCGRDDSCLECARYCEVCSRQFCFQHMDLENLICHECNSMEGDDPDEFDDGDYEESHDFDHYDEPDYGPQMEE
jgi:hypothetical protein